MASGIPLIVVGGLMNVVVGGSAAAARDASVRRADRAESRDEELHHLERAGRAHDAMLVGLVGGVVVLTAGIALTVTGAVLRRQARTPELARLVPAGRGLAFRF